MIQLLGTLFLNATILLVGDSHLQGPVGDQLAKLLSAHGPTVRVSVCGARFEHYLKSLPTKCGFLYETPSGKTFKKQGKAPHIHSILTQHSPDWVIVNLGTNELSNSPEMLKSQASHFLKQLPPNSKCILIGPYDTIKPQLKANIDRVNQTLSQLAAQRGCHWIRADHLESYPTGPYDGIHFPATAAKKLGQKLYEQIKPLITVSANTYNKPRSGTDNNNPK